MPTQPLDLLGRGLRDLRISVTDRCNFRCVYCMPREVFGKDFQFLERRALLTFEEIERVAAAFASQGVQKIRLTGGEPLLRRDLERRELLTFEEIVRVARVFVDGGVQKIRLTGGEPLVRRDLERLIAQLAELDVELTLTTNASLLPQKAQLLADAGLRRITVSLDSLDDAQFRALNDVDFPVARVLEGIDAAAAAGLPVKVNAVIKRGANDDQIVPMARYFRERGHTLRFIEFMDVGHTNGWRLDEAFGIEPVGAGYRGEVAKRWRYRDGKGEFGVIASVTQPFCGDCTRARLSAEGKLFTCLFAVRGHDLRALIRGGASDEELETSIRSVWQARADRYSDLRSEATESLPKVEMSYIGG